MVNSCAVFGCSNRSNRDNKSFYLIPSVIVNQGEKTKDLSEKRRSQWITNLRRECFTPSKHTRICSDHFITGKPSALYDTTNPDWAPTVDMGYNLSKADISMDRYERNKQRKEKKKNFEAAETLLNLSQLFDFREICDSTHNTSENEDHEEEDGKRHISTQTDPLDPSPEMITIMRDELQRLTSENMTLRDQLQATKTCQESFEKDEDKVRFYSGLPSFVTMMTVFTLVEPYIKENSRSSLTKFQKYVLVLMKLRINMPLQDLAYRFSVSVATVSNTFRHVVNVMYHRLRPLIRWPDREVLQKTMPMDFRKTFGVKVVVIIDCFEIFTDRPSNVLARAQTWSNYKHHNTVKFLIGIAPQGTITFLSNAWGGRTSDKCITENSGLLEKLLPYDMVLADRGFDIEESVGLMCAELRIPAFTKGKKQLSPLDVEETRKIAHVRIHVERVIGNLRNKYTIVNGPLPIDFLSSESGKDLPLVDKIVTVCCGLTNLCESVVPLN